MLFFTRAFLCIGTVVVLAEGFGPGDLLKTSREAAGALGGSAATSLGALCRTRPADCMAVVEAAATTSGMGATTAGAPGKPNAARAPNEVPPLREKRRRTVASGLSSETGPPK